MKHIFSIFGLLILTTSICVSNANAQQTNFDEVSTVFDKTKISPEPKATPENNNKSEKPVENANAVTSPTPLLSPSLLPSLTKKAPEVDFSKPDKDLFKKADETKKQPVALNEETDSSKTSQTGEAVKEDNPERTAQPAPYDAIYPSTEFLGPTLGVPKDTNQFPLMRLLGLKGDNIRVYGWIAGSYNYGTSKNLNFPSSYDIVSRRPELNQAVLRIERQVDTVQTEKVDYGFRLSNIYGIDYRFTTQQGFLSRQLLGRNRLNGYDAPEAYGLIYIPKVAKGMLIKFGRFISPPDIEAQLAPDNYIFTHSIMFTVDPYTFTGVNVSIKLNNQFTIQAGVHGGNDVNAFNRDSRPTGQFMVRYVSKNNKHSLWGGINALALNGNTKFKGTHDQLQMFVGTYSYAFSKSIHTATEGYYMFQRDAALGGTCNFGPVRFGSGGGCGPIIPGVSGAIGIVNYTQFKTSSKSYVTIRNDFLNDLKGQRTGFATPYSSHTLGYVIKFNDYFQIRPEIRYERAYKNGVTPYDLGTKRDQTKFAIDTIIRF